MLILVELMGMLEDMLILVELVEMLEVGRRSPFIQILKGSEGDGSHEGRFRVDRLYILIMILII